MAFFFFGGKTLLKNESLMLFGNGGAVVADGKGIESAVLADFYRQLFFSLFFFQGCNPVIDEIGEKLAQLPRLQRNLLQRRSHLHNHIDSLFLRRFHFGLKQGVYRGLGGFHGSRHPGDILEYRLHIFPGILIFPQLQQSVDHLQVVHIIMSLGAQLQIQVFQVLHTLPIAVILVPAGHI